MENKEVTLVQSLRTAAFVLNDMANRATIDENMGDPVEFRAMANILRAHVAWIQDLDDIRGSAILTRLGIGKLGVGSL